MTLSQASKHSKQGTQTPASPLARTGDASLSPLLGFNTLSVRRTKKMTNVMDIEVTRVANGKVRVKFVAFVGEIGPEFVMPEAMAIELASKIDAAFTPRR